MMERRSGKIATLCSVMSYLTVAFSGPYGVRVMPLPTLRLSLFCALREVLAAAPAAERSLLRPQSPLQIMEIVFLVQLVYNVPTTE
jgi:hypothetical protein